MKIGTLYRLADLAESFKQHGLTKEAAELEGLICVLAETDEELVTRSQKGESLSPEDHERLEKILNRGKPGSAKEDLVNYYKQMPAADADKKLKK